MLQAKARLSSRWDGCVYHHWGIRSNMWLQCQQYTSNGLCGATSLLLQLPYWQQSVYKTMTRSLQPTGIQILTKLLLWVSSGWQRVCIQLQPDCDTQRKSGHLCFEQHLFSPSSMVCQRGHLWGQLHGSKIDLITVFFLKTSSGTHSFWFLCRCLWGVIFPAQLGPRKTTGMLWSKLYVWHYFLGDV